jgi:hypothetical protein
MAVFVNPANAAKTGGDTVPEADHLTCQKRWLRKYGGSPQPPHHGGVISRDMPEDLPVHGDNGR